MIFLIQNLLNRLVSRSSYLFCVYSRRSRDIPIISGYNYNFMSRQLNMSFVPNPGTSWYFCASTGCTSDNRKRRKYGYMSNVQVHAYLHTREKALIPHPPFPPTGLNSSFLLEVFFLILKLSSKINQCLT